MSKMEADLNRRILVIDDTVEIHGVFRRLLAPPRNAPRMDELESSLFGAAPAEVTPFEVDCAFQGEEGLSCVRSALAERRPYAMAFVDMRMPPGWDGIQTIEAIWCDDPDLEVVICSAYSDHSEPEIAARLGASDQLRFLRKPFDATEVRALARTLTEKWTLRQRARVQLA